MSQQQQPRPQGEGPIKYGDVFRAVEGELAKEAVAPRDAAMMQTAESEMMGGQTLKGGAAAAMQSAAWRNEMGGFVGHDDMSGVAGGIGVSVTKTVAAPPGSRVITEAVGGQVVGQYNQEATMGSMTPPGTFELGAGGGGITIGEALEATTLTAGQKPVEWSDAAAIQAAEVRATGLTTISPGGVAAAAQSAATLNARTTNSEDKTKLADVLSNATLIPGAECHNEVTKRQTGDAERCGRGDGSRDEE